MAGNKSEFASWPHWFSATENLPCNCSTSAVTYDFFAPFHSRRDANLLHICPSICQPQFFYSVSRCIHITQSRQHCTLCVHLLACWIQMTIFGPSKIFVFINMKLYLNGCYFVTRPRDTKPIRQNRENNISLFSAHLYPTNVAKLPKCRTITLTVMVARQNDFRKEGVMLVPSAYSGSKYWNCSVHLFLLLRHGYCLEKYIKSIRKRIMLRNKKWNTMYFIQRNKLQLLRNQNVVMATLNNRECLLWDSYFDFLFSTLFLQIADKHPYSNSNYAKGLIHISPARS